MAQLRVKSLFYNFILLVVLLPALLLSLPGLSLAASLALEQEARCGMEEHVHTQDCYLGDVLLCTKKMHTHSNNCYLVLLSDNDINQLLSAVSSTPDKSLESIITAALAEEDDDSDSLQFQPPEQDPPAVPLPSVSSPTAAPLVLNGKLTTTETLAAGPSDVAPIGNDGISPRGLGDDKKTSGRYINFYIYVVGEGWTYIGNLPYTMENYYARILTADIEALLDGYDTFQIRYHLYESYLSSSNNKTTVDGAYTTIFYPSRETIYARILHKNANSASNEDLKFYRLTYIQPDGATQYRFVAVPKASTVLPALPDGYIWQAEGGTRYSAGSTVSNIRSSLIFTAVQNSCTVTFLSNGSAYTKTTDIIPGSSISAPAAPTRVGYTFGGWYKDEACTTAYNFESAVTSNLTLYAKWTPHTYPVSITYQDANGGVVNRLETTQSHDATVYLDENYTWSDTAGNRYASGSNVPIQGEVHFVGIPITYTLHFTHETNVTTQTVLQGERVTLPTLPAGYTWYDSNNKSYSGGDTYGPVTSDMTFLAVSRTLTVNYTVNFPNVTVDKTPTLYGTTSATGSDTALGGRSYITRSLTSRKAAREDGTERYTYFFRGWQVQNGDGTIIPPDSTLSWSVLDSYDTDGDGKVNLVGVWENAGRLNSITFYVRLDSAAVDTNGNITGQPTTNYTPPVFYTHVGGVNSSWSEAQIKAAYQIADTSSDNSFGADQKIRALYGEKAEGMWLYDFPTDNEVFAYLKNYITGGKTLTVDDEPVKADELDSRHYAIRWYVCKLEGSAWHIDGRLVRKEGTITVDKSFGGDPDTVALAKNGFYIVAENGTKDANGNFVPYKSTDKAYKRHVLQLKDATVNGNSYEWRIDHVLLDEYWRVTEYPVDVEGSSYYAEYSVYDTDGSYTAMAEYGTQASAVGKTFALDEDPDQGLLIDFRNYYYDTESILIKKEDAATGLPIGGAVFELWQNGTRLTFDYDAASGQYVRNEAGNGTLQRITTEADGFSIISTTGFSYEYGDVVVKEVIAPAGYAAAPDVTIGLGSDKKTVVLKKVANTDQSKWKDFAEVPNNDVLVVKDNTADYIAVNVKKLWNTNTPADSVDVVLQANGGNAAAVFPGLGNAQVKLNEANNWSYTWTDLPRYANGLEVTWSVKEVVVGNTPTMADGVTFANWIVTYSPGTKADLDADGKSDDYAFTVTNTSRSPKLILTKVSTNGSALPGATFRLEQVQLKNGAWQTVSGSTPVTATTDATGMITFDNLVAGAFYRLTETGIPPGHFSLFEPVVLTVNGVGEISQVDTSGKQSPVTAPGITHPSAYNIQVVNHRSVSLPETGGPGRAPCAISGTLLMAAALLLLYRSRYGKEEKSSS